MLMMKRWGRIGVIIVGLGVCLLPSSLTLAATVPTFAGYHWPTHQTWQYQADLTDTINAQVSLPGTSASSESSAGSSTTPVAIKEIEHWAPVISMRTAGVKAGGLFVQVTFARAPLTLRVDAPQLGADQGQSFSLPALTVEGRLTVQGRWKIIEPLTAEGAMPSGLTAKALVPLATSDSNFMPPVPQTGWISGKSFVHNITLNPQAVLSSNLTQTSDAELQGVAWMVATRVSPERNVKGNWMVTSQANTPTPLTATVTSTVAKVGTVHMKVSLSVQGSSQVILSGSLGGLFKRQESQETVAVTEVGSVSTSAKAAPQSMNETAKETMDWSVSPLSPSH